MSTCLHYAEPMKISSCATFADKTGQAVEISLDYPWKYTNKSCSFVSKPAKAELHEMETNFLNSHRRLFYSSYPNHSSFHLHLIKKL
jgi:hypothetical protein